VDRVFDHWRSEHKHPKAVLSGQRRKVIQAALKDYDEATLCTSISGYRNSPHHMGENDQRTVYDDISLFLRDSKHIEAGLHFARGPPPDRETNYDKFMRNLNGTGDNSRVIDHDAGFPAISRD
jgi:hypothetical protein